MAVQQWSESILVAQLGIEPGLTEDLDELVRNARSDGVTCHVVVDLAGLNSLTSSHLSALLRLRKALNDRDASLRLAAPDDEIWALFLATGLDKVFHFAADTSTALAQLQISR